MMVTKARWEKLGLFYNCHRYFFSPSFLHYCRIDVAFGLHWDAICDPVEHGCRDSDGVDIDVTYECT